MRAIVTTLLLSIVAPLMAQDAAPAPKRSLADGLVRQRIEIDRLSPPRLAAGVEIGAGEGPLVLLVRRKDGSFELHELDRGRGDHGPSPEPALVDEPAEQEEVVEEVVVQDAEVVEQVERPAKAAKPAAAEAAPPPFGAKQKLATVRLALLDGAVTVSVVGGSATLEQATADRDRLVAFLAGLEVSRRGTPVVGQVLLECVPDVDMQDLLAVFEAAGAAGFAKVMLSGFGTGSMKQEQRERILEIGTSFRWPSERRGPRQTVKVYGGELLVLLDGPARWTDVGPLFAVCAQAGIWRIGFVGQKDAKTRVKLPTNLPFDRGF